VTVRAFEQTPGSVLEENIWGRDKKVDDLF